MNVNFKIRLEECNNSNKNFLVFISTELTTKLKYELVSTNTLVWSFRRENAELSISHGSYYKESYEVREDRYSNRMTTKYRDVLDPDVLELNFKDIESIEAVNAVFDIVNKYAKLKINEHEDEQSEETNELTELVEGEVATTSES